MYHDQTAEQVVLGGCFQSDYCLFEALAKLEPEDFYYTEHKSLFGAILSLHNKNIKISSTNLKAELSNALKSPRIESMADVLRELSHDSADFDFYINQVRSFSEQRHVLQLTKDFLEKVNAKPAMYSDYFTEFNKETSLAVGRSKDGFSRAYKVLQGFSDAGDFWTSYNSREQLVNEGKDPFPGFRTGYKRLDGVIGGFERGTITTVGARSSSGKTTFVINLIMNLFRRYPHLKIGFFTLEMPNQRIIEKLLCTMAGVHFGKYSDAKLSPVDKDQLEVSIETLKGWDLRLFDKPGLKISQAKNTIRREVIVNSVDIFFIDYLTRIRPDSPGQSRHHEIDQLTKGLQDIAIETNKPIIMLSQLNRQVYNRAGNKPCLGDLKESGSIEEDSDTVLMLHRPAHYDATREDVTEVHVVKNRLRGDLATITYDYHSGNLVEQERLEDIMPSQAVDGSIHTC